MGGALGATGRTGVGGLGVADDAGAAPGDGASGAAGLGVPYGVAGGPCSTGSSGEGVVYAVPGIDRDGCLVPAFGLGNGGASLLGRGSWCSSSGNVNTSQPPSGFPDVSPAAVA